MATVLEFQRGGVFGEILGMVRGRSDGRTKVALLDLLSSPYSWGTLESASDFPDAGRAPSSGSTSSFLFMNNLSSLINNYAEWILEIKIHYRCLPMKGGREGG